MTTRAEIPVLKNLTWLRRGQTCQGESPHSGHRYIACGAPAVAIIDVALIDNGNSRAYAMCLRCAMSSLRFRGASVIHSKDQSLRQRMKDGSVRVK